MSDSCQDAGRAWLPAFSSGFASTFCSHNFLHQSEQKSRGTRSKHTARSIAGPAVTMPGSGKQSVEIQEQIKELLEAGFDPTTIHRKLKVGRSSIYRMKRCLQQHGTNYMPPEMNKKNGRPKVLTPEQELVCIVEYPSGQSHLADIGMVRKCANGFATPRTGRATSTTWCG